MPTIPNVGTPAGNFLDGSFHNAGPRTLGIKNGELSLISNADHQRAQRFAAGFDLSDVRGGMADYTTPTAADSRWSKFKDFATKKHANPMKFAAKAGLRGLPLELAFAGAFAVAGAITGAAAWGAPTGLSEDYVGGAIYGGVKAGGSAAGMVAGSLVGGVVGSVIPGIGTVIGTTVGAIAGSFAGDFAGAKLFDEPARQLGLGARAVVQTARAIDRVQFGGSFVDSRAAFTMRQAAVQDMSQSMMNARQYLGNEAIFLHER
jgi:hypothetical protein